MVWDRLGTDLEFCFNPPSRPLWRTRRPGFDSPQLAADKSPEFALGFIPLIGDFLTFSFARQRETYKLMYVPKAPTNL